MSATATTATRPIPRFRTDFEILFDLVKPALQPVIAEIVKQEVNKILAQDCNGKSNMYSRKETAEKLKISDATVINWEKKGILTPIHIGKSIFYSRQEVLSLITR